VRTRGTVVIAALLGGLVTACSGSAPSPLPSGTPPSSALAPLPGTVVAGSRAVGSAAVLGVAHRVHVGDVQLAYREFGAGPPLVLIAGQGSAMQVWGSRLPRLLSRHFRVVMFDNRGVGWSTDVRSDPLTIQLMADDTARLLAVLHIARANVIGWSTGGEIALALAVRHPGAVGRVVLSGATAGGRTAVQSSPRLDRLFSSRDLRSATVLLERYLFTPAAKRAESAYVRDYLSVPAEPVSGAVQRRQAAAERRFVASEEVYGGLPKVRAPVLVANGALDRLVPPANARIIARRLPHARLVIFRHAAHALMFQAMPRFVALVNQWVAPR
jgi:pimeloyl-ACP methyl ester carboxylesterase